MTALYSNAATISPQHTTPANTITSDSLVKEAEQLRAYFKPPVNSALSFLFQIWRGLEGIRQLAHKSDADPIGSVDTLYANSETGIQAILNEALKLNRGERHVWADVATRSRAHKRGGVDDLQDIGTLWVDIDCLKHGVGISDAVYTLTHWQYPPNIIVFTGGGISAWWLLDHPVDVSDREKAFSFKDQQTAFFQPLTELIPAIDRKVWDSPRMMRLPETVNWKPQYCQPRASIIYWDVGKRYSYAEIQRIAPITARSFKPVVLPETPDGIYSVSTRFVAEVIYGENPSDRGDERHGRMYANAQIAAGAGMPQNMFIDHFRPICRAWFAVTGEEHRADGELSEAAGWGFAHPAPRIGAFVRFDGNALVETDDPALQAALYCEEADTNTQAVAAIPLTDELSPDVMRKTLPALIRGFRSKAKNPTVLLLKAAPGAGKTRAILHDAESRRVAGKRAIIATRNKAGWSKAELKATLAKYGINSAAGWYAFEPRQSEIASPSYCERTEFANLAASRGFNARRAACVDCPLKLNGTCEQQYYLSQVKAARLAQVIVCRHEHLRNPDLLTNIDYLYFDETPETAIGKGYIYTPSALTETLVNTLIAGQPENANIRLINQSTSALQGIIKRIEPNKYDGAQPQTYIKPDGRWLWDALEMQ
ncbi:MAG: hypothetical protein KF726_26985, partial [Anaerolineae bacterium]|nr:hypothetical protein [Anaerolineae bacterium]